MQTLLELSNSMSIDNSKYWTERLKKISDPEKRKHEQARIERAMTMGFKVDERWYHGTTLGSTRDRKPPFTKIDFNHSSPRSVWGAAFYVTQNKDVAKIYNRNSGYIFRLYLTIDKNSPHVINKDRSFRLDNYQQSILKSNVPHNSEQLIRSHTGSNPGNGHNFYQNLRYAVGDVKARKICNLMTIDALYVSQLSPRMNGPTGEVMVIFDEQVVKLTRAAFRSRNNLID